MDNKELKLDEIKFCEEQEKQVETYDEGEILKEIKEELDEYSLDKLSYIED